MTGRGTLPYRLDDIDVTIHFTMRTDGMGNVEEADVLSVEFPHGMQIEAKAMSDELYCKLLDEVFWSGEIECSTREMQSEREIDRILEREAFGDL